MFAYLDGKDSDNPMMREILGNKAKHPEDLNLLLL
jgi:hypothetical protein